MFQAGAEIRGGTMNSTEIIEPVEDTILTSPLL